ncbi:MAG: dienelactone hydrolase family protein [Acidobacteria bacterium]|nr:dienelactone hydrolase family protein [Acidobacteriota bacterium]MBV9477754.1 dienelactone hydrolase family protein [Acidobacteriota bacterium]
MTTDTIAGDELEVPTPDGRADAVLYRWTDGAPRPGVIFLPDGIGSRPSQRQMARRVAGEGYTVLLPNIYYRVARPPVFTHKPDFGDERTRTRFAELTGSLPPDAMERDGAAYVDFLASRADVSSAPIGITGFCFTGKFALRTAAARPDRIGAAASFHGGGLWTSDDKSPHFVLPRVRARLYFGHARDDRSMSADAIAKFEEALVAWGGRYESETYDALHGWTVPDSAAYDEGEAERAFAKLRALFAAALQ